MTLRDKIIEYLKSKGHRQLPCPGHAYLKFTHSSPDQFYWVGKIGGLRVGETFGKSISVGALVVKIIKQ